VKGVNPLKDLRLFYELYRFYKKHKPALVHHFTIKPVIYGALAAKLAGVPVIINTIMGLGYVFTGQARKKMLLKSAVLSLYRLSGLVSDYFFFSNNEDRDYFLKLNIISASDSRTVCGVGADVRFFAPDRINAEKKSAIKRELGLADGDIVVLMAARMLYDKGVAEFVEAGRMIGKTAAHIKFILAGPLAPGHPAMIPMVKIQTWVDDRIVQYLGLREDVRELMAVADMVVLPSYYSEGLPSFLMEAAAMGKPIITTDNTGCREVVKHGKNGFIIPIKNASALQAAIETLAADLELRRTMGRQSRLKAVRDFDEKKVISQIATVYHHLLKVKNY